MKTLLKKGDIVEVRRGEEKGKRGKILKVLREENRIRCLVEGVNLAKKHQRPRGTEKPGGIIDIPQPIAVSNLVFICPKCGNKAKLKREVIEGRKVRRCRECLEVIE
ncbi:MAG: 50S ribosomal protein L24 [candidate division WOR-3 bacterium]